ncbi:MAG: HepT-like ribonuclease domain-containing protein [Desulfobulbaceae bacterium]
MKDDRLYLIHLSESIEKIESYTKGLDFSSFMQNTLIQDALLRNLQVLSESTQRLSEDFKMRHSEIEWYKIAGLRNILVHDYPGIDLETVWAVVSDKPPELKTVAKAALK